MPDMDLTQIVKTELAAVEAALKSHVSAETAARFTEATSAITKIQADLDKLQQRDPSAEAAQSAAVKALETKLAETENTVRELSLKAASMVSAGPAAVPKEERDAEMFKGAFFTDGDTLKKRLRDMHGIGDGAAKRQIDSSLFVTGGKLSAETADRFIDWLTEQQTAISRVTTRRMNSPQGHTDELTVARRSIRKAVEGIAPNTADAIGTKRRTMNTVEVIWAEDLTLTFLEDNIERRGAESHIAQLLARQFGNDVNDLAWNGNEDEDSNGGDDFEAINDGWIQLMLDDSDVNDLNAGALVSPSNTAILSAAMRAIPVKYQGLPDIGIFVPVNFASRYADELSTRETSLGDAVMINGFPALKYFGRQVIPEPHLYENNIARAVVTPLSNLYHGIQRQIMIDSEWQPRKRAVEFTITMRNDYQYSTGEAIVLVSNIPSANR